MTPESNCILERRFGTFRVSEYDILNDPNAVMALLGRCLIFQADFEYINRTILYEAASPEFEPCEAGERPREYYLHSPIRVEGEPKTYTFMRMIRG